MDNNLEDFSLDPQLFTLTDDEMKEFQEGFPVEGDLKSTDEYMNSDFSDYAFDAKPTTDNALQIAPAQAATPAADEPLADNYDADLDLWYNIATPRAPGASFKRGIGWYYKVSQGPNGTLHVPQSAYASSSASGYNTPTANQGPFPYPYAQPPAAPTLKVPQPRPGPTFTPRGRGKAAFNNPERQDSIDQACVCAAAQKKTKVKRPRNCFILYRVTNSDRVAKELGIVGNQQLISKAVSERWHNETVEVRRQYTQLATQEAENHRIANPDYVFRPGKAQALKFGTPDCTCGAYEANVAYNSATKKAQRALDRARMAEAEAESETEVLPTYDPVSYQTGSKRKMSFEKQQEFSPRASKRPMRSTRSSTKSYRDADEDAFSPAVSSPEKYATPAPAPAPVRIPSLVLPPMRRYTPPQAVMTTPTAPAAVEDGPAQHTRAAERRSMASLQNVDELLEEWFGNQSQRPSRSSRRSSSRKASSPTEVFSSPTRRSLRIAEQQE
ncbi:Hypothetical predicted protein [Lecanosticta acicola]|uniref:HMG box domain-containing protein n=1 Tax=Lecanosticta acicola TaxID=111012 RepID=A0AAI8YX22_9PEZI|nr:Hypothetical predicted protein [Lecanosticta acicola]